MTASPATTTEMDQLDQLGAKAFDGFLVRKDLVREYSRQYPVPTYVVEFLLGRYCASTDPAEIEEGLQIVEKQLQGRSRDQGSVKIIDIVWARLDTRSDFYMAEVPSLAIKDAQIVGADAGVGGGHGQGGEGWEGCGGNQIETAASSG